MTTIMRPKTTFRLSAAAVALSLAWLSSGCAGCEGPGLDIGVQVTPAPDLATLPVKSNPFLSKEGQGGLAPPRFTPKLPPKTPFLLTVSSLQDAQRTLDSLHRSRLAMREEAAPLSAQDMLDKLLALKHYRWVDNAKPVILTMNAPKEHLFGEVLALALTSEEALMSAVPDLTPGVPIERPEAHSAAYWSPSGPLYIDIIDRYAVFTRQSGVFEIIKASLTEDLLPLRVPAGVHVHISTDRLKDSFPEEVAAGSSMKNKGAGLPITVPFLAPEELAALTKFANTVDIGLNATEDALVLEVNSELKQGIEQTSEANVLLGLASTFGGKTATDFSGLPAGAWLGGSLRVSKATPELALLKSIAATELALAYGTLLDLTPDERAASEPLWQELAQLVTGNVIVSAADFGGFGATTGIVMEVTDAGRARLLYERLAETLFQRIIPRIQDGEIALGDAPIPEGNFENVDGFIAKLNEGYAEIGMRFFHREVRDNERRLSIETLGLAVDADKLRKQADYDPMNLADLLGNQFEISVAFREDLIGIALGPEATQRAAAMATGVMGDGNSTLRPIPSGHSVSGQLDLQRMLEAVPFLWPNADRFARPTDIEGVAHFSAGCSSERTQLRVSIPLGAIALLEALEKQPGATGPRSGQKQPAP